MTGLVTAFLGRARPGEVRPGGAVAAQQGTARLGKRSARQGRLGWEWQGEAGSGVSRLPVVRYGRIWPSRQGLGAQGSARSDSVRCGSHGGVWYGASRLGSVRLGGGRLRSLGLIDYPERGRVVAKRLLFLEGA